MTASLRLAAAATLAATVSPLSAQLPAYNIPDDPAFTFLGTTPKKVGNPGTTTQLGFSLANGINASGRVENGLAVSFLPITVFRISPTLDSYRNRTPAFWRYNTQVSVGTVRTSGDTASTDLAVGVRTIFRGPDPYADSAFVADVEAIQDRCLAQANVSDSSTMVLERRTGVRVFPTRDEARPENILKPDLVGRRVTADTMRLRHADGRVDTVVVESVRGGQVATADTVRMWVPRANEIRGSLAVDCGSRGKAELLKQWMDDHWNDRLLSGAVAGGTRFVNSEFDDRAAIGYSGWVLGAVPLRYTRARPNGGRRRVNLGQLAGQLRYDHRNAQIDTADDRSGWNAGLRAMAGRARYNAFAEVVRRVGDDIAKSGGERGTSWSAGVEYMVGGSTWLSVGFGDRYSEALKEDRTAIFLNFKWGLAREANLGAR